MKSEQIIDRKEQDIFRQDELKDLVLSGYELALLLKLKPPRSGDPHGKYEVESRSKVKNLPEALREMDDPAAGVTHFVKNAAYFLPRAERGEGRNKDIFMPFLDLLLKKVEEYSRTGSDPEQVRKKIQYLIGYANWSADSLCFIFTSVSDRTKIQQRVTQMLNAELMLVGGADQVSPLADRILKWKETADLGGK